MNKKRSSIYQYLLLYLYIFTLSGCVEKKPVDFPCIEGYWKSVQDRPSLRIGQDEDGYYAIVYHHTAHRHICPIRYPLIYQPYGIYLQAERRILVSYSKRDSSLFLSPGGKYYRHSLNK